MRLICVLLFFVVAAGNADIGRADEWTYADLQLQGFAYLKF